jgi:hypothetical protein
MAKKQNLRQTVDSIEAIKELPGEFKKNLVDEMGKGLITDLWAQMLGTEDAHQKSAKSGELKPGEELNLKKEAIRRIEPAIDYARELMQSEKSASIRIQNENKNKIQQIMIELKSIAKTSKQLEVEFKDVAVESMPVNPGKFHLNFFEWVLSQLRRARMRIEDSAHWTNAMKSKKSQKQYWALFKKHGTSFGLSSERVVSTQTG